MSKNTEHHGFEPATITVDGGTVKIKRNRQTEETARELSAYIHALDLPAEKNNALIALIIEHVQEAERGAFAAGLLAGKNKDGAAEPEHGSGRKEPPNWLQ